MKIMVSGPVDGVRVVGVAVIVAHAAADFKRGIRCVSKVRHMFELAAYEVPE
jgi:hypothetical protein